MNKSARDLILIILVIASVGYWYMHRQASSSQVAVIPPVNVTLIDRPAPAFTLPRENGSGNYTYSPQNSGRVFLILQAVECAGCQARSPVDAQARDMAQPLGFESVSMLVYAQAAAAHTFVQRFHPVGEVVVYDSNGAVSVNTYHGSDDACWMLVKDGRVRWSGGPNLSAFKAALNKLI